MLSRSVPRVSKSEHSIKSKKEQLSAHIFPHFEYYYGQSPVFSVHRLTWIVRPGREMHNFVLA